MEGRWLHDARPTLRYGSPPPRRDGDAGHDEAMNAPSTAWLRQIADELGLKLGNQDLARLRPMVADLLAVGRRLRLKDQRERPIPRSS